jgi:hypothetical protein
MAQVRVAIAAGLVCLAPVSLLAAESPPWQLPRPELDSRARLRAAGACHA